MKNGIFTINDYGYISVSIKPIMDKKGINRNELCRSIDSRYEVVNKWYNGTIEKIDTDKVSIGSTVSIKYVDDDDTDEYKIVGSQEADPFMSKISNESPIAKAILNKKVGDIVEVESPNGVYKIEITEIK